MKKWTIRTMVKDNDGDIFPENIVVYDDLKTLKGVLNRIKKWKSFNERVIGLDIYVKENDKKEYLRLSISKYNELFQEIKIQQIYNETYNK